MRAFLQGKQIYLRALTLSDVTQTYTDWLNDEVACRYNSHHRFPNTIEKTREYVEYINNSREYITLAICENETNKHLGNVSLQSINFIDSNAEFAILIGETSLHVKGIGTEAAKLIINHAFDALNIHRIYCGTSSENIAMQKLAIKAGFVQEGISRDALFKNGKYVDTIHYGLINPKHV